jgi:hypothetical protein
MKIAIGLFWCAVLIFLCGCNSTEEALLQATQTVVTNSAAALSQAATYSGLCIAYKVSPATTVADANKIINMGSSALSDSSVVNTLGKGGIKIPVINTTLTANELSVANNAMTGIIAGAKQFLAAVSAGTLSTASVAVPVPATGN